MPVVAVQYKPTIGRINLHCRKIKGNICARISRQILIGICCSAVGIRNQNRGIKGIGSFQQINSLSRLNFFNCRQHIHRIFHRTGTGCTWRTIQRTGNRDNLCGYNCRSGCTGWYCRNLCGGSGRCGCRYNWCRCCTRHHCSAILEVASNGNYRRLISLQSSHQFGID